MDGRKCGGISSFKDFLPLSQKVRWELDGWMDGWMDGRKEGRVIAIKSKLRRLGLQNRSVDDLDPSCPNSDNNYLMTQILRSKLYRGFQI